MSDLQLPLLQLFQNMRQAGLHLTIEQYDLLRQSLNLGFGLDWESLERTCQLLWVKPSRNYDLTTFQTEFARFRQQHQAALQTYRAAQPPPPAPEIPLGVLPQIPPRRFQTQDAPTPISAPHSPSPNSADEDGLGAIDPPSSGKRIKREPQFEAGDVPITLERIDEIWRSLRYPVIHEQVEELDWDATEARIRRNGLLCDLVMRPWVKKGADLLLLIDEGNGMIPFAPVYQSWVQAVEQQKIPQAQLYRFSCEVSDAVFDWHNPLREVPLNSILMQLHPQRTVVILISDAGAATQSRDPDKIQAMQQLLKQFRRTVRAVIWLNPVSKDFWSHTAAEEMAAWMRKTPTLNGSMLPIEPDQWQEVLPLLANPQRGVAYAC